MDIEGSEVAAARGMGWLLSRPDAPTIVCASNSHTLNCFGLTPADLKTALAAHGHRTYLLGPDRLVTVAPEDPQVETVVDLLAIKTASGNHRNERAA